MKLILEVTEWRSGLFESGAYNIPRRYKINIQDMDECKYICDSGYGLKSGSYIDTTYGILGTDKDNNLIIRDCELLIPMEV